MRLAAALALMLGLPLPAAADVTARYAVGREALSIEVDDGGDYRAEIAGKFALIRRGGSDYVVLFQGTTPLVVPRQTFLDLAIGRIPATSPNPDGKRDTAIVKQGAEELVASRRGDLWTIRLDRPNANTIEAVMCPDRDLAPVGKVFAGVLDAGLTAFARLIPPSDFAEQARAVFAKGTPLRATLIEELRLQSVSKAPIDAARFALPGPVLDSGAFDKAMSAPIPTHAETTVIVPTPEAEEPSP